MNKRQLIRVARIWGYIVTIQEHPGGSVTVGTIWVAGAYDNPITRTFPDMKSATDKIMDNLLKRAANMIDTIENTP